MSEITISKTSNKKLAVLKASLLLLCLSLFILWYWSFFILVMGEGDDKYTYLGFAKHMFWSNGLGWKRGQLIFFLLLVLPIPYHFILFLSVVFRLNPAFYKAAYLGARIVIAAYSFSAIFALICHFNFSSRSFFISLLYFLITALVLALVGFVVFVVPYILYSAIKTKQSQKHN